MKSVTKSLLGGMALFLMLFSVNVFSQEVTLAQDKILEIQDRVNSMPVFQLNDRRIQLLEEVEELENEQSTSQSPPRLKAISDRLNEIFVELDMIQTALVVVGGAGILGALTDDNSRDITPPIITVNGSNPVTVERGTTYSDAGATANGGETVITNLGSLNTNVAGSYTVSYSATDNSGNTGYAIRTVNVVDTTAPEFTSSNVYSVLEGISSIGSVTVEQNTRATRHNPISGDGRVSFSIVNDNYDGISANAISIDSSSALLTFNITTDYDSMYNNDDGSLDFTATVTATDASGNAVSYTHLRAHET